MSGHTSPRLKRIADQLQRELAILIQQEVKDPRVGMVSVTGVDVSRDLAHANVHVTVMGSVDGVAAAEAGNRTEGSLDQLEIDESIKALNKASGFLRSLLAKRLSLRTTPKLVFRFDSSISRGQYLSSLIDHAIAEDSEHQHDD